MTTLFLCVIESLKFGLGTIVSLMRFSISRQVLTGSSSPKTFPLSSIPKRIVPDPKFAKALTVF